MRENMAITKITCMCCGKRFGAVIKKTDNPNRDSYVECPHCQYEHVVRIRDNKLIAVSTP